MATNEFQNENCKLQIANGRGGILRSRALRLTGLSLCALRYAIF
jgi:hypothetical protein